LHGEGIAAADVEGIEIGLGHLNWLTVGAPYDAASGSVTHAQFNAAYSFARALADGRLDLRSYEPDAIVEPAIVALTAKTRVVDDPSIDGASQAARAVVKLRSGRVVQAHADVVKGSPQDPMSDDELVAKFRGCFEFGTGHRGTAVERLADLALNLEDVPAAAGAIVAAFP
jgi:2-methylcitrate dehydratase PrpD